MARAKPKGERVRRWYDLGFPVPEAFRKSLQRRLKEEGLGNVKVEASGWTGVAVELWYYTFPPETAAHWEIVERILGEMEILAQKVAIDAIAERFRV